MSDGSIHIILEQERALMCPEERRLFDASLERFRQGIGDAIKATVQAAQLQSSGYLDPSQYAGIDRQLNLPPRAAAPEPQQPPPPPAGGQQNGGTGG